MIVFGSEVLKAVETHDECRSIQCRVNEFGDYVEVHLL